MNVDSLPPPTHLPEASRKQPPESWMPLEAVVVAPVNVSEFATFKFEVVALVPVALVKLRVVKFARVANSSVVVERVITVCSAPNMFAKRLDVVAEVPVAETKVKVPNVPKVEERLVEVADVPVAEVKLSVLTLARVANKSVDVAWVVVLLPIDRYCSVDDAREIVPLVKVCSWFHVFIEVVAG